MNESSHGNQVEVRFINVNGKPFAVRLIHKPTHEIKQGSRIVPLPEFGAIAFNYETFDGRDIVTFNIADNPQTLDSTDFLTGQRLRIVGAVLRAEVWLTLKGERKRLAEEWFTSETPQSHGTPEQWIKRCLAQEDEQTRLKFDKHAGQSPPPPPVSLKPITRGAEEKFIDHQGNANTVTNYLLKREYPNFFKAYESRQHTDVIRKAFIADVSAIHGHAPDVQDATALLQDSGFFTWLSQALRKPGRKVSPEEWELATGWIPRGYFQMSDAELQRALNKRCRSHLKGFSWRRKAQRMGLHNARKIGCPEKPNSFPTSR